jgi:hypothetical protein
MPRASTASGGRSSDEAVFANGAAYKIGHAVYKIDNGFMKSFILFLS